MKALYKPKNKDRLPRLQVDCIGHTFNFKPARPLDGVARYWPDDILFPGSGPIPETDLIFSEEQGDVYCHKCSEVGGGCVAIFHLPPVCG